MKTISIVCPRLRISAPRIGALVLAPLALVVSLPILCLLPPGAHAQVLPDTPANRARGVVGCRQTSSGITCPGGSSGGAGSGYSPEAAIIQGVVGGITRGIIQGIQEAQRRHQQRLQYAYDMNETGNRQMEEGLYHEAANSYREALRYSPNDGVIQQNLKNAEWWIDSQRRDRIKAELGHMMEDLEARWGSSESGDSGSGLTFAEVESQPEGGLEFAATGDELFSKGTKSSAPVSLKPDAPDTLAAGSAETGAAGPAPAAGADAPVDLQFMGAEEPPVADLKKQPESAQAKSTQPKYPEVPPPALPPPTAWAKPTSGELYLRTPEGWQRIVGETPLLPGDEVRVGAGGDADIVFPDGTKVQLHANDRFILEEPETLDDGLKNRLRQGIKQMRPAPTRTPPSGGAVRG